MDAETEPMFTCHTCGKRFDSPGKLKNHIRLAHVGIARKRKQEPVTMTENQAKSEAVSTLTETQSTPDIPAPGAVSLTPDERALVYARHALAVDRDGDRAVPLVEEHLEERGQGILIGIDDGRIVDLDERRHGIEQHQLADERAHRHLLGRQRELREALGIDHQQALVPVRGGELEQRLLAEATLTLNGEHDLVRALFLYLD